MSIRIALAEDNAVSKRSFLDKARMIPEWEVVFTAANGKECLDRLGELKAERMPQVIFMDLEMPGVNGIDTISIAHRLFPDIYFIALTVFDDDDKIFEAIRSGAHGYLLKQEEYSALKDAVTNVIEYAGAPMSPAIARKTLQLLSRTNLLTGVEKNAMPGYLTPREKEVLEFTVMGWDAKRIAAHLDISKFTVRKHIENIYNKLHVQSKAEVISMAHHNNWVK